MQVIKIYINAFIYFTDTYVSMYNTKADQGCADDVTGKKGPIRQK